MKSNVASPPDIAGMLAARFPLGAPQVIRHYEPGSIALGLAEGKPAALSRRPRFEHTHIIGTTGGGKTNLLEHVVRQDIKNGDGTLYIDPHGNNPNSSFRSLLTWVFSAGYHKTRKVHVIDPNCRDYTTGFNPLALFDPHTSVSVVADMVLEAFQKVWGGEDTHVKPTIRRILKATFAALAELRLTLAEAEFLFDHQDRYGLRALVLRKLTDRYARAVLSDLDQLARSDRTGMRFREEIVGPVNRLAEFVSSPAIRNIIGQRTNTIDLRAALDRGDIILVNLSAGDRVSDADTELLGRLLIRCLFHHVTRRTTNKPFWLYIDECQRFLSGDIARMLAEARKFSCGVCLCTQWQSQLGKPDDETLAAVQNATNIKISFRIKHPVEAKEIAEAIMPLNLETPVNALVKPTIVGHVRTAFKNWSVSDNETWGTSTSTSSSQSVTDSQGTSESDTVSQSAGWDVSQTVTGNRSWTYDGNVPFTPTQMTVGIGRASGRGSSGGGGSAHSGGSSSSRAVTVTTGETTTESYSHGRSESHGASEGLEPVYRDLPSAVHSFENTLYFAAQALRSLAAGEAFVSFVDEAGLRAARVRVPRVKQLAVSDRTFSAIRSLIFSKSSSAIESSLAVAELAERERQLIAEAAQAKVRAPEPTEPKEFRVPAPTRPSKDR